MKINEVFYSLQGEGSNMGRPAVFCRFTGCNLWSGREVDRASAVCQFCDTEFLGGETCIEDDIIRKIDDAWRSSRASAANQGTPLVIFTGGEPALQVNRSLVKKARAAGFEVAIETNGTVPLASGIDHITVSPKAGSNVIQKRGTELKVVWPQPLDLDELATWDFRYFFLQPMDGVDGSVEHTLAIVLKNPKWRLSLQTHKILGIR